MLILSLFRTESSLDPVVQALEVLITSELNMNQAAPGVCGIFFSVTMQAVVGGASSSRKSTQRVTRR